MIHCRNTCGNPSFKQFCIWIHGQPEVHHLNGCVSWKLLRPLKHVARLWARTLPRVRQCWKAWGVETWVRQLGELTWFATPYLQFLGVENNVSSCCLRIIHGTLVIESKMHFLSLVTKFIVINSKWLIVPSTHHIPLCRNQVYVDKYWHCWWMGFLFSSQTIFAIQARTAKCCQRGSWTSNVPWPTRAFTSCWAGCCRMLPGTLFWKYDSMWWTQSCLACRLHDLNWKDHINLADVCAPLIWSCWLYSMFSRFSRIFRYTCSAQFQTQMWNIVKCHT